MRVLVVGLNYAPEPTGIAPYTTALCRGLADRGHDVRVLTTMPHYPEWRIYDGYEGWSRHERCRGVRVHRMRHYVPTKPTGIRRLVSELSFGLRVLAASWGRPDIVVFISPALFSTALAMVRARAFLTPTVVWVQDLYSLGLVETANRASGGALVGVVRRVESSVLSSASGLCVIHARFAAVAQQLGASLERVQTVRNWTHLPSAGPLSRQEARGRLGWRSDELVALHSGAMGRKQDLDNVVAAARLADATSEHVRFVLMGNGSERVRLEASAAGVRSITFVDPIPGALYQAALAAADVLVVNEHAGLRDMAVPSKLTSYFSSGRPIVAATDADSVTASELAASGAGIRVNPGEPQSLLRAFLDLSLDPVLAREMGARGQRYRETELSETAAIDRFTAWLVEVCSGAQTSRPRIVHRPFVLRR